MESAAGITIQIEVLEVEGLSQSEALRFRRAVEQELARLVAERGLSSGALRSRTHVAVEAEPAVGQGDSAARAASAIYRALDQ